MTQIKIIVESRSGSRTFSCIARRVTSPKEHWIDGDFYQKWTGIIPEGVHHELVLEDPVPVHEHLHVYQNPEGKKFVCWTGPIPTQENAVDIFKMWCVGSTYTLNHNGDFLHLYKGNTSQFLEFMRENHKTIITNLTVLVTRPD